VSLLQSHLGRLPDKSSFHQISCQDLLDEVCKAVPAGAHPPCGEPVEDTAPAMPLLAPLTKHHLPLASIISPGPTTSSVSVHSHTSLSTSQPFISPDILSSPQVALSSPPPYPPDSEACPLTASSAPPLLDSILTLTQRDSSMALPLGPAPQSLFPHPPWSASLIPAISGLGHSHCPVSALSWWQAAAKALYLSTSSEYKSQKKHLSHNPEGASFWIGPTDRQVEASSPSLLSSHEQKLLDIQVTKRVEIKIWKEKEKDESHLKQMSQDCHLNSLRNMLESLHAEQDTTTPQPFWSTKDKPGQLPGPQQFSYPKVLGNKLQQKYNQLFWGLPSLHSESLVATVSIPETSSVPQSPFLFNKISHACPVQMQAKIPPLLSQFQPLSHLEFQSRPFIPTIPQFQPPPLARIQTQAHLKPSLPILPSSSSAQIRASGLSCPTSQNKPQSLTPTEIQHSEWSLLQKQLENRRTLSSVVKQSEEVFNVFPSNLPEDSWVVSILPENFPISPELRKQLEIHLQNWLIQHRWELPQRIQESLEIRQLQEELPGTCQTKGNDRPSQPSSFTGESSKVAQKVRFQLSQGVGKGLGHILGKVPKDLSRNSESSVVKFQEVNSEESENDLRLLRSDSEIDLLRSLDKNLDNILKGHLGRKLGQNSKGFVPVNVHQSSLDVKHPSSKSDTHAETSSLGILKGWEPCVNTCYRVSFLDPDTQEELEAHITRFWVKHRWGLPLKVLKPINLFKLKKPQPSPMQFVSSPSATYVSESHSTVKFAEFLGKPPQARSGEKVKKEESVPTLIRPLLTPSPVYKENQRVLASSPCDDYHEPSEASLTALEDRSPSHLKSHPGSTMARNEPREESGGQAVQDPSAEAKESPAFHQQSRVTLETKVLTKPQTTSVHRRNLEAPGASKHSPLTRMSVFQHPGEPCLNTDVASKFKSKVKARSNIQFQHCPKHTCLAVNNLTSPVPPCHPQRLPTRDRLASQTLCVFKAAQRRSLGQQEPKTSKLQDSWKSQSKMRAPTYKREDCRRHKPGEHKESFKELGTSQAGSMRRPAQVWEIVESVRNKCLQVMPEKKRGSQESLFKKKIRLLLKWIFPSRKVKSGDALQKCKPISATAQSEGPVESRSIMNSENAEAQALMTAVGQILEEKMAIHHGLHATKVKEPKQELQALVCRGFCYHRLPSYPQQGKNMGHTACSHQATSKGQSCSIREREVRHQQSSKSVRFDDEQLSPRCLPTSSPKKTLTLVCPCQYGPRIPGAPVHHQHCPRHCHLWGGVLPAQP
uniref:Uncharacterized protein n=1 Tax=Bos indicus x Bos taurus TaxID=30522 RepID=A0A4W2D9E4_BOBOX